MKLIEIQQSERGVYSKFVAGQHTGSFLQSWEWGEWQEELGRTVKRFKILDDNGEWAGAFLAIEMPVGMGKYYVYVPYGPVINNNFQFSFINFQLELRKLLTRALFVRIEPKELVSLSADQLIGLVKVKNIQPGKTLIVDLTKPEDVLLSEMHHKTRYNIRIAQKHGVVVKTGIDSSALGLIARTSSRHGFVSHPQSYYQKMVEFFASLEEVKTVVYRAEYENKVLASAIMVDFGGTRTYLFGGSSQENKNVMAPYVLHWQAMVEAKNAGYQLYDFWGTETAGGEMPGFVRFKLGFGGREAIYPGAHDLVNKPIWYRLYGIMRVVNRALKGK